MKKLLCLLVVIVLVSVVFAARFDRTISITGGSPRQMSIVLKGAGYAGPNTLQEITVCNPASNAANVYQGQANVSASNGFPLEPGSCYTSVAASQQDVIDATQLYLFTTSTQSVGVVVRSK